MKTYIFGDKRAEAVLIQAVDAHDFSTIERQTELIKSISGRDDFAVAAVLVDNWNDDLSPWAAPAVFGKDGFSGGGERTLDFVLGDVLPRFDGKLRFYIGGYSLAGLFSLWAASRTDVFSGVAAASASVWFPDFVGYIDKNPILSNRVYLSLGDKEEKTKNPTMATVGDAMRSIYAKISRRAECVLEWNEGNHFRDPELRTAKGFSWLIK